MKESENCTECEDNQGWYPMQVGESEYEQVQCEWCYTNPNSIFNLRNNKDSK